MEQLVVRVLLVGDAGVGKTSILLRYAENSFEEQQNEFDSKYKTLTVKGREVKLTLMDTAGQERFRTLTSGSYRGVDGVFICYNVTDSSTFSNVPQWLQEVTKYAQNPNLVKVLAGNKCDLPDHAVSKEEGNTYASSNGMKYFETSAKDNIGITDAFQWIVEEIVRVQTGDDDDGNSGGGGGCCTLL